jgi:hypothetical protein
MIPKAKISRYHDGDGEKEKPRQGLACRGLIDLHQIRT